MAKSKIMGFSVDPASDGRLGIKAGRHDGDRIVVCVDPDGQTAGE